MTQSQEVHHCAHEVDSEAAVCVERQSRILSLTHDQLLQAFDGTQCASAMVSRSDLPHLHTPYEVLIHALATLFPSEARWWSRGRAYTVTPITPAMWGLMKVAGKRLVVCDPDTLPDRIIHTAEKHTQILSDHLRGWMRRLDQMNQRPDLSLPESRIHHISSTEPTPRYGQTLESIIHAGELLDAWVRYENERLNLRGVGEIEIVGRRWGGKRRVVGALALDADLTLIGYALNHPQLSPTAHAEWCLLDQLWRTQGWPTRGPVTLISSLKPCKLCAGAWVTHAPDLDLRVYFLRDDPGPSGQNTAFDEGSYAHQEAIRWRSKRGSWSQMALSLTPPLSSSSPSVPRS